MPRKYGYIRKGRSQTIKLGANAKRNSSIRRNGGSTKLAKKLDHPRVY